MNERKEAGGAGGEEASISRRYVMGWTVKHLVVNDVAAARINENVINGAE